MAAHDQDRVYRLGPSSVYINPTNKTDRGANFGGTLLGLVAAILFNNGVEPVDLEAEEYGTTIARQRMQRTATLSMLMRQWDKDTAATFFPTTVNGDEPTIGTSGDSQGQYVSSVSVLVAPPPAFETEYPCIYLLSADPLPDDSREARAGTSSEFLLPAFFETNPPSGGGTPYRIALLADLPI